MAIRLGLLERTRIKLVFTLIFLFPVEALVKALLSGFPFTELIAAQLTAAGMYVGAKTVNNIKEIKQNGQGN